jgi:hypothetical protein
LAFASANANVPEVERLTSRETRAEERASATQQLCSVLAAVQIAVFKVRAPTAGGPARIWKNYKN